MDKSHFDNQAKQNLGFYSNFLSFMLVSAIAIAVVLALMAIFLL